MKAVFDYIDLKSKQYFNELTDLCSCRSVKGDTQGLESASGLIRERLDALGFEIIEKKEEGCPPVFLAHKKGKTNTNVIIYNHYDVVPEGKIENWSTDPFTPSIIGGRLWGRGVSDDKGALIARLQAVSSMLDVYGELPCNISILFEGEEETGSNTLKKLIAAKDSDLRKTLEGDMCLWENGRVLPDSSPEAAFGVRATLMVTLKVTTMNCEEHGRMGAELPNAAWRLVWALSSLKNMEDRVLVDGFYDDVLEPTKEDIEVVANYPYDEKETLDRKEISSFVNGLEGVHLKKRIFLEPSLNINGFESGEPWKGYRNIVPHTAKARLSVILVPNQSAEDVLYKIKAYLNKNGFGDIEVEGDIEGFPIRTPMNSEWRRILTSAAQRVYEKPLTPSITQLGSGPAYMLREVNPNLPIIAACGVASLKSGHHSPKESISLDEYIKGVKFMASFLQESANFVSKA